MIFPPPRWLKVNVDGCVLPSNLANMGVILCNERGDAIEALGVKTTHWDSTTVELIAMTSFKHIIQLWMYEY